MRPTSALVAICLYPALHWLMLTLPFNISRSQEPGLYWSRNIDQTDIRRGELLEICLPLNVTSWALEREYLPSGWVCPGGGISVGKLVVAVGGDVVEIREDALIVNGTRLPGVFARHPLDRRGRRMPLMDLGSYRIQPGQIWLHSGRNQRSFDSRVYGPVDVVQVRGRLRPLWIWE